MDNDSLHEMEEEKGTECQKDLEKESVEEKIIRLQEELAAKEEESQNNYDMYLRTLAELDNLRKRNIREREELTRFGTIPFIKKLLPIIDDLERAAAAADNSRDYEALHKGIEMIARKFKEIMEEEGVETIEALGKPFDPEYHQPLMVEENSDQPSDIIIEEMQKGYMLHGKLIRPSLVKVSR